MTLPFFNSLPPEEQLEILDDLGAPIGEREQPRHHIVLFQLGSFYVEVYFSKKDDTISKISAFDRENLLQPYLEKIDLTGLLT